ncbi:hypothetical protein KBC86_05115, partial [Candidatus Gracilibacteria bacterium]|nr:hypothetical protein [Candidatus Gracilibacteria bacterium]
MKSNKNILPVIMAGLGMIGVSAQGSSFDDMVQSETVIPMQKIESTGPAIAGVRVKIQGKIYLLLLDPTDASHFPETLIK